MRVLHVHSGNLYGGVETFLASLARFRTLAPCMDMSVALTSDGQIAAELRESGVDVSLLGEARMSRPLRARRARKALVGLIARDRPSVVVCHQAWPLVLFGAAAKSALVPIVLWIHMAATRHWLDRLAWRVHPDVVVCNSKFTASTLPPIDARVEIAYAPVPWASSSVERPASSTVEKVIVQIGRMEPLKGHEVLLDALARLRVRHPWVCWMAGGAQRQDEQQYARALSARAAALGIADRVKFLGHRSDIAELLRGADVCCQPNVQPEGFGLAMIEALASGVPVVASALGGALEIVDESCGVLVPPRDPGALASAIERLLTDEDVRACLGAHAPARAKALCDPATQMTRIAAILQRAARAN